MRTRRHEDLPSIAEASHDPETRRWLDDEPLSADRRRDSIARAEERWRTGESAPFVIAEAATDAPLGLLNVQFGEDREVAELAVSVFPRARGRGVGSRALRLSAIWALRELGLQRVVAEAAVENVASARAIERAGFHREGLLRAHCKTHGRRHDCIIFSLVPSDIGNVGQRDFTSSL